MSGLLKKKVWSFSFLTKTLKKLFIPKIPVENVATALAALYGSNIRFDEKKINFVLQNVSLPGRFQIIQHQNLYTIILDVAHNPHAAKYLANCLYEFSQYQKIHAVIGMVKEKNIKDTLSYLIPIVNYWYCGKLDSIRSAHVQKISFYLPSKITKIFSSIREAFSSAKYHCKKNDIILVFGSFYTVAEVIKIIQLNIKY